MKRSYTEFLQDILAAGFGFAQPAMPLSQSEDVPFDFAQGTLVISN